MANVNLLRGGEIILRKRPAINAGQIVENVAPETKPKCSDLWAITGESGWKRIRKRKRMLCELHCMEIPRNPLYSNNY